jgi:purine-binding chemotaxis protein CheW
MSNPSGENLKKNNQYLTFRLQNQQYGIPIVIVREINRITEITTVPRSPSYVAGVINLRGKVIPVVDLRLKLAMERQAPTRQTCVVVVEASNGFMGIIVDQVFSVIELKKDQIEASPQIGNSMDANYVLGMGKIDNQVIILVDILKLLGADGIAEINHVAKAA